MATEPQWIGVNVDLSQAESRVTDHILASLVTDPERRAFFAWRALVRPDEFDQHTARAASIFKLDPAEVTKQQRYLGKKTVHAFQRGMGADKLQGELLKDGLVYTERECKQMLAGVDAAEPELREVYFPWVRQQIILRRRLTNSWGRRWCCEYDRFDDALYRRGYSFFPQSEVSDWMNQKGTVPVFRASAAWRQAGLMKINAHVHDSLFLSCAPEIAYAAAAMLVEALEQPRLMYGAELVIPCEVEIGRTWKGARAWKRMPGQEEFNAAVKEVLT